TIIECLKYATTGDLPPNSKGGAFIHDPRLAGEKEVLAQVKLSFKSTSGAKMVATRSLQLTVKKSVRAQKTLDCTLLMAKNGEKTTISSRVAELDQILPQYLGVSRAVLDSVIFCHQDESLWPMSEPSALKKKFDEIFEALKYTKAIDNIKALRKKQNEELGKYKIMEQHAKEDKDKADRAEKKSKELSDEIETLRVETKDLHTKARDARDKSQDAWNQVAAYTEVVESLKVARKNQEWYEKHLKDLAQDLKERSESDEWLQKELDQYEERMQVHDQRQKEQTRRYEDVKQEITQIRKNQSEKRVEAGKHEERKITHLKRIENRNLEIKQTAKEHNIHGYDTELDDMEITEYIDKITKRSKDQNAKMERLRRDNMSEIQKVQEVLDSLRERRSALQEGKKAAKDQMSGNDKRIASLYSELNSIATDEGGKAALESNIEELEGKLSKAKQDLMSGALDAKIEEVNAELRSLEDKNVALNKELIQGTKQAGNLARLDHLKKESTDRQRSLKTMTGAHDERLRSIIGHAWQATTLEVDFQRVMDSRTQQVKDAERQRDGISRELEQLEFKLKTARTDTKKREGELEACAQILTDITNGEPDDYPEILAAIQSDRDTRKYDVDGYAILKKWYSECIETAKSKEPACRLCNRAFTEEKAIRMFVSKLEKTVSKRTLDQLQKELEDLDTDLEKARDASTTYDTWRRLSEKELPHLRTEIAKLERSRETLLRHIEEHDKIVEDKEEARRDAETLTKPVANIAKYSNEYASYQTQIQELIAKQQDVGLSRTLEDLQDEIECNGTKSRTLRTSLTKLQNDDKHNRGQVSSFEVELSRSRNRLASATHELEKRTNILSQIEDVKNLNHEQRGAISKLDGQLQSLGPQFSEQEAKRDDIKQRGETRDKELQKEARNLSDSVRNLQRADLEIRAYIEEGGPAKLAKCQRDIQGFEQDITRLEAELKQITIEINKIREELANHDQNKRVINDNLKFRKTRRELEAVKVEIQRLRAKNAEADQEHYRIQAEKFQRQHSLFSTEETSKMGIMKAKDDQLMQLLQDWNTDYKDAAYKFKKSHIEVEVRSHYQGSSGRSWTLRQCIRQACFEIPWFHAKPLTFPRAIMKYHSLKMEEINRIIEELWKRTYQGTDVDTVLIRSDNETAKGNRSYNYRVCMLKQDVEMDMRGRCSAGQKVLACIIIRLALAECFGVNCGLIALDEPTTNLDRDNIKALAESLHYIIKSRQQQSNFQLIVITHDEDFLRYMKCADFCDTYYRVSRNDRQKSIIERQSIAEVI
ncbi:DNA repair protein rad50, partial [Xylographa vitiligo]|nr:DNA repair protein rad50 [Xylographa vitiligo]